MRDLSKFLDNLLQWIRYLIVVILALLVILKAMLMCGQMHIGIFPFVLFPKDVWPLLISIFAAHLQHAHANELFNNGLHFEEVKRVCGQEQNVQLVR